MLSSSSNYEMEYEIDVKFSSSSASTSPIRSTKPLSVAPLSNNAPSSTSSSPLALLTKKDLLKNLERSDNSSLLALPSDSNSSSSLTVPSLLSQKLKSNLLGEEEEYDNALFKKPAAINTSKMNNGNAINCKKQPPSSNFTPFQKGNKDLKAADDMLDLFTMKSPIGALATDLDVNFSLKAGSPAPSKNPRRLLLKDLTSCTNVPDNDHAPSMKSSNNTKRLFSRFATADPRLGGPPSSSPPGSPTLLPHNHPSPFFPKQQKQTAPSTSSTSSIPMLLSSKSSSSSLPPPTTTTTATTTTTTSATSSTSTSLSGFRCPLPPAQPFGRSKTSALPKSHSLFGPSKQHWNQREPILGKKPSSNTAVTASQVQALLPRKRVFGTVDHASPDISPNKLSTSSMLLSRPKSSSLTTGSSSASSTSVPIITTTAETSTASITQDVMQTDDATFGSMFMAGSPLPTSSGPSSSSIHENMSSSPLTTTQNHRQQLELLHREEQSRQQLQNQQQQQQPHPPPLKIRRLFEQNPDESANQTVAMEEISIPPISITDIASAAEPEPVSQITTVPSKPSVSFASPPPAVGPHGETTILPCLEFGIDGTKKISPTTLVQLLNGTFNTKLDEFHIVDCRFPYEYEGGHIHGAKNVNSTADVEKMFLANPPSAGRKVVIVFHCEFSAHRAPRMAQHLRNQDRNLNFCAYPNLYYPEVYILKGGYHRFYSEYKEYCEPKGYVSMDHKDYKEDLKKEMTNSRRIFKRTKSANDMWFGKK